MHMTRCGAHIQQTSQGTEIGSCVLSVLTVVPGKAALPTLLKRRDSICFDERTLNSIRALGSLYITQLVACTALPLAVHPVCRWERVASGSQLAHRWLTLSWVTYLYAVYLYLCCIPIYYDVQVVAGLLFGDRM
jgi:uncharacterized membrane protein